MPVFINEVVFRGEIQREAAPLQGTPAGGLAPDDRAARSQLVAEVAQAVIDHLEQELERIGER